MLEHQEKCVICGYKPPLYFWFVLSGFCCDVIQASLDYLISILYTLQWERITVCWTLSYILSIWIRHYSHKLLVFGDYGGSYLASLGRTYLTYSGSIVLSIITNLILVQQVGLTHRQAWFFTMLWTGIVNYFLLKRFWRGAAEPKRVDPVEAQGLLLTEAEP